MARASSLPAGLPRIRSPRATTVSAPMTMASGNVSAAVLAFSTAAATAKASGSFSAIADSSTSVGKTRKSDATRAMSSRRRGEAEARTIPAVFASVMGEALFYTIRRTAA